MPINESGIPIPYNPKSENVNNNLPDVSKGLFPQPLTNPNKNTDPGTDDTHGHAIVPTTVTESRESATTPPDHTVYTALVNAILAATPDSNGMIALNILKILGLISKTLYVEIGEKEFKFPATIVNGCVTDAKANQQQINVKLVKDPRGDVTGYMVLDKTNKPAFTLSICTGDRIGALIFHNKKLMLCDNSTTVFKYYVELKDDVKQSGHDTFFYHNETWFQGEVENNQPHGMGKLTYPNGEYFELYFENGQVNCRKNITLHYHDHPRYDLYIGPFQKFEKDGKIILSPHGKKGYLKYRDRPKSNDGKPSNGSSTYPTILDCKYFWGEFDKGKPSNGNLTFYEITDKVKPSNGSLTEITVYCKYYEGDIRDDLPNGKGRLIYSNNFMLSGEFKDGICVKQDF